VKSRWKMAGCEEPTGLALDKQIGGYSPGCGGDKKNGDRERHSGKVIAIAGYRDGCDATAFDVIRSLLRRQPGRDHYSNSRRYADRFQRRGNNQDSRSREDDGAGSENSRTLYGHGEGVAGKKVEPVRLWCGGREVEISLRWQTKRVKGHIQERPFHITYARIESSSFLRDQVLGGRTKAITGDAVLGG